MRFTAVCLNLAPRLRVCLRTSAGTGFSCRAYKRRLRCHRYTSSARFRTKHATSLVVSDDCALDVHKWALGIALINGTTHCSFPRVAPVLHTSTMRVFAIAATFAAMLAVVAASPLEEKRCATYLPCPCSRQPGCACC
jgi:hypothetical protein